MSFASLEDIPYFSLAGFTLNVEEKTVISSSLQIKKDQEKCSTLSFWGKIQGIQRDYLIAQSTNKSFFDRKYFYSVDLVNWLQLPDVSPVEAKRLETIQARFMGDPTYEYLIQKQANESELRPEEKVIKEEKRLAHVVALMNYEVQVVPRGAYYRDATHRIALNPNFNGLSKEQLTDLSSYLHFRDGFQPDEATLKTNFKSFDETLDIFESIQQDEPKGDECIKNLNIGVTALGSWSLQTEKGGSISILRSLTWPGYVFYHSPSTHRFGSVYFGTGQKNSFLGYAL